MINLKIIIYYIIQNKDSSGKSVEYTQVRFFNQHDAHAPNCHAVSKLLERQFGDRWLGSHMWTSFLSPCHI